MRARPSACRCQQQRRRWREIIAVHLMASSHTVTPFSRYTSPQIWTCRKELIELAMVKCNDHAKNVNSVNKTYYLLLFLPLENDAEFALHLRCNTA